MNVTPKITTTPQVTAESDIPGGRRLTMSLDTGGEPVPAILLLPVSKRPSATGANPDAPPTPGAVLLHGFNSRKERMAETMGRALLTRGIASLSIDLPRHGARVGAGEGINLRDALKVAQIWRLANENSHLALRFLAGQTMIDRSRIGLVGYSLGAYIAVRVAADPLVRVLMLAAGGDLPEDMPFVSVIRTVANPLRAVRKLAGKPLLMVNGTHDRTIRPQQARRLFEAALHPKAMLWYEGGHWPPAAEITTAAAWLAETLCGAEFTMAERSA